MLNIYSDLEQAPARDKKRRATDFLFRRLRTDEIEDISRVPSLARDVSNTRQEKQRSASQDDNLDIPQIRTTLPGEEVKEMKALKAAIKSRAEDREKLHHKAEGCAQHSDPLHETTPFSTVPIKVPLNARRFQLSREHATVGPSKLYGGVRKPVHRSKAQLATFVEKGFARMDLHSRIPTKSIPIDRIVEVRTSDGSNTGASHSSGPVEDRQQTITRHTLERPFVKTCANEARKGRSINSHPDTWDFDSDQLASELAAFAFELDPTGDSEPVKVPFKSVSSPITTDMGDDEYVYETYIRIPHNADSQAEIDQHDMTAKIGVLVIAEEDEELWEAYGESDGENEWDEEDADSNGWCLS